MIYIIGLIFIILICCFPTFRCAVFHPIKTIKNAIIDTILYFKEKRYNNAEYGFVDCYTAADSKAFGCGKTLSAVNYITDVYDKYNDKMVWDRKTKRFVKQKFYILSNVEFTQIPYIKLTSMKQYIGLCEERYKKDQEEGVCSIIALLVDEAGSAFNSRSFKDNFDPLSIKTMLTARHYKSFIITTAQRFSMVDALMRQITNKVIACDKLWRFQRLNYYDAYEMENAQNPALVQPYRRTCWFITNKAFAKYDTYQLLSDIKKKCDEGDMLTEAEILMNQANVGANTDAVLNQSKKFRKTRRKIFK